MKHVLHYICTETRKCFPGSKSVITSVLNIQGDTDSNISSYKPYVLVYLSAKRVFTSEMHPEYISSERIFNAGPFIFIVITSKTGEIYNYHKKVTVSSYTACRVCLLTRRPNRMCRLCTSFNLNVGAGIWCHLVEEHVRDGAHTCARRKVWWKE